MNIATGLLDAPTVKTAGILDAIISKGLVGKALPEVLGHANYGLSAGIGAGGSELLRRGLRRTNLNPYLADAIGVGAGGLVGGGAGAAGALGARITPQIGGATAGRAAKNLLGATALGAGGIAGLEGGIGAYQAAKGVTTSDILERISEMYSKAAPGIQRATLGGAVGAGGLATLSRDARRYLAGLGTSATGGSMLAPLAGVTAGLGAPIAGAGILGAAGLKNEAVRRALVTGGVNTGTGIANTYRFIRDGVRAGGTGVANSYRFLRDGVRAAPGGSVLAGLGGIAAGSKLVPSLVSQAGAKPALDTILATIKSNPDLMGAAGGLAGLGALLNPTIRGGLGRGISGTARGLYNAPSGSVLAGLGGLTAAGALAPKVMSNPEVLSKLEPLLAAAKGSPVAMGAAGGLAGLGALRSGMTRGSMINRIARNAPGGTLPALGGAGLFAAGHPFLGAASMLSAPMVNRTSSRYLGDLIKEIRALRSNKRALDGLYKKSSLEKKSHIKLAAPVFLTKPSYILDAPTMEKVGFGVFGEAIGKGLGEFSSFLGRQGRKVFAPQGQATIMQDLGQAFRSGAGSKGTNVGLAEASTAAERGFMTGRGPVTVRGDVARRLDTAGQADAGFMRGFARGRGGSRGTRGFQFQGSQAEIDRRLNQDVIEGYNPFNYFRNRKIRAQNRQQMMDEARRAGVQFGESGSTALTAPVAQDFSALRTTAEANPLTASQRTARETAQTTVGTAESGLETARGAEQAAREALAPGQAGEYGGYVNPEFLGASRNIPADRVTALQGMTTTQLEARLNRINMLRSMPGFSNPAVAEEGNLIGRMLGQGGTPASYDATFVRGDYSAALDDLATRLRGGGTANNLNTPDLAVQRLQALEAQATRTPQEAAELNMLKSVVGETAGAPVIGNKLDPALTDDALITLRDTLHTSTQNATSLGGGIKADAPASRVRTAINDAMGEISRAEQAGAPLNQAQQELKAAVQGSLETTPGASVQSFSDDALNTLRDRVSQQRAAFDQRAARSSAKGELTTRAGELTTAETNLATARGELTRLRGEELEAAKQLKESDPEQYRLLYREITNPDDTLLVLPRTSTEIGQQVTRLTNRGTAELLAAPIVQRTSKLEAPVLESLQASKASPELTEHLSTQGLNTVNPEMQQQMRILQGAGVDTGSIITRAAKRSGLDKAVRELNSSTEALVGEAQAALTGSAKLNAQDVKALNQAVRDLTSQGQPINKVNLEQLLGTGNSNIDAAVTQLDAIVTAGTSRAASRMTSANEGLAKVMQGERGFNSALQAEFSAAQQSARVKGFQGMGAAREEATRGRTRLERLTFRNRRPDLAAEDAVAFEQVEALTNARLTAMTNEIKMQGANAGLVQAVRPQLYEASAAVMRSRNPEAAREWSRILQQEGSLAENIENSPILKNILEREAPQVLKDAGNPAFNLNSEMAKQLSEMIPVSGRGAKQNIAKEVEMAFKPETLDDLASPQATELLGSLNKITGSSGSTQFGDDLTKLLGGTLEQQSAARKIIGGADDVGNLSIAELEALGYRRGATQFGTINDATRQANVTREIELSLNNGKNSIEEAEAYLNREIDKMRGTRSKKKGTMPQGNQERLEELQQALVTIRNDRASIGPQFKTDFSDKILEAKQIFRQDLKGSTRVDISQLKRNTDFAAVEVDTVAFDKAYRAPSLGTAPVEGGAAPVVYDSGALNKQLKILKGNPENANIPEEVLKTRIGNENLNRFIAENPQATPEQILEAERGIIEALGLQGEGAVAGAARGQQGGLGIGGMLGGTAVIGGGAYASNNRPTPITQAAQQMRPAAAWGLSPLHAPVQYRKKTASLLAAPLHKLAMDMPKPLKVPLPKFKPNQMTKAPVKAEDVGIASPLTSMLTAPIAGGGY